MLTRQQFALKYVDAAFNAAKGTDIFGNTILSVASLESNDGNSELSRLHNNFFGIKSSSDWKGQVVKMPTREYKPDGTSFTVMAPFRKYNTPQDSFADYVRFLQVNPRYRKAGVFDAKTSTDQWDALRKAGYATDPRYAQLVLARWNSLKTFVANHPIASTGAGLVGLAVLFFSFIG